MKQQWMALSLSVFVACGVNALEWDYSAEHGPDNWGQFSAVCETGKNQSPINVKETVEADLDKLHIDYQGQVTGLTNNGHTLQATVSGVNTLNIDGRAFELKQFHFHTPSENLIRSRQYPLEGHFVHADEAGNLAVLAVMFELGVQNDSISKLSETIPTKGQTITLSKSFDAKSLLPSLKNYYRFNGSLTTPPCSEGVRWIILRDASSLSEQQTQALTKVMGTNNRPVQDQNARLVTEND
ncbi:carbonic anhydrase [Vibrio astriarenae]